MIRLDVRRHLVVILLALGGVLLANLLFLSMVNRPRMAQQRNADTDTGTLAGRVQRAQARVAELQELFDRVSGNREKLDRFINEDLSTKDQRLVALQREIHDITDMFRVEAAQLKFSHEPVEGTRLTRLMVDIPLAGGYKNLRQFIQSVEDSSLVLVIESVQIQRGQGGALLNLNVRLATYFADETRDDLRYGADEG